MSFTKKFCQIIFIYDISYTTWCTLPCPHRWMSFCQLSFFFSQELMLMFWLIESTNTIGARCSSKYKQTWFLKKIFWTISIQLKPFQVPKAASTSWTSLLLSDRQFSDVKHKIGQQHTYLRCFNTTQEIWLIVHTANSMNLNILLWLAWKLCMKDPKISLNNTKGALNGTRQDIPAAQQFVNSTSIVRKMSKLQLQLCAHVAGNWCHPSKMFKSYKR